MGAFSSLSAPDLGAAAIRAALERAGIAGDAVEEVIMGNVVQAGIGQAPARQAAIKAGIPGTVPAFTVNKVCGSGLKAIMLAAQAIRAGDAEVIVAGGMESMTNAPYLSKTMRFGAKMGNAALVDGVIHDGLWCAFENQHMGVLAEYTATKAGLSRTELDEFSARSQQKAAAAIAAGHFKDEIVPVSVAGKKGEATVVTTDETPRGDTTAEGLSKLKPVFQKDGMVTAGNAPGLSDGASATVVASAEWAAQKGLKPLARITGYASGGTEPKDLFFAPIVSTQRLMAKTGVKISDYDLIEANEAFASQALADGKGLGWDERRVNVCGGAIALGHPIGSSGSRLVATIVHQLRRTGGKKGLVTLCLGGGNAVSLSLETI